MGNQRGYKRRRETSYTITIAMVIMKIMRMTKCLRIQKTVTATDKYDDLTLGSHKRLW